MVVEEVAKPESPEHLEIKEGIYEDFNRLPRDLDMPSRQEQPVEGSFDIRVGPLFFDYEPMREEFLNGNVRLRLVEEDQAVRGFIVFTTPQSTVANTIKLIWVSPDARGRGLGVRLVRDAVDRMQAGNVHMDILGGLPMIHLAQKLGFVSNPGGSLINRYTLVGPNAG